MAVFRALGVNSETERQKDDFYSTDPKAVESLIRFLKDNNIEIPYQIVESSVGMGHIAKVFEDEGHNVTGYDIIDRGWHDTIVADYLLVDRLPECCNTRKWYQGFDIKKVYAHRSINCKGNKRDVSEIIITNF